MSGEGKTSWAMGILGVAFLSLGGFVLYESYTLNAEIAVLQNQIKKQSVHSKHWKLHGWAKDRINELRVKHDLAILSWPGLSEGPD